MREHRKCPFCGEKMICVNTQDGEFTCTSCAEYANHDVLDFIDNLKAEKDKLKANIIGIEDKVKADIYNKKIKPLEAEIERLKSELEMEHDDCSNAKKCEIEYHKAYEKELDENVTLRKENAKLKCLDLLLASEMYWFKSLCNEYEGSDWWAIMKRQSVYYHKAYRKAKAELKEKK